MVKVSSNKTGFHPLNIGRFLIFNENQTICGLVIEARIERGVVRRLSEILGKFGIIVHFVQFSMTEAEASTVKALAFLDFSNSQVSPEELLERVKKQEAVLSVELIRPKKKGFISDTYFFPLVIANERVVVFRKSVYEALLNGIRKQFGTAGEAMLYYAGFNIGQQVYDEYVQIARSEEVEDLAEVSKAINMTLGWGVADIVKVDKEMQVAIVRMYENFECELGRSSGKPYSHFYRGAIAGFFTKFFRKEAEVQETKCIAKGDPYCEFHIKTA